jgi:dihydrodipicolinate synthase/N-acetylneuraminate lyase
MANDTTLKLAQIGNIVGIKDATSDLAQRSLRPGFHLF